MKRARAWSLPISLALHGLGFAALLLTLRPGEVPPPPAPQIMLLPAAPLPPLASEAMPSPNSAPIQPLPSPQSAVAARPAPDAPWPIASLTPTPDKATPKPRRAVTPPDPSVPVAPVIPEETARTTSEAAAIPVSGMKTETATIISQDAASPRPAGPPPDYIGLIRAKLEKAKHYPAEARSMGQEGTVSLRFTLSHDGQLLDWTIHHGSEVAALDQAAGEILLRAAPFPPFPDSLEREKMALIVPIEFSLKTKEE